jgi:hypothetical protein
MNKNLKTAILVFGGGIVLYWAFTKIRPFVKTKKLKKEIESGSAGSAEKVKKAGAALRAYNTAKREGQPKEFLDELNLELMKEYGVKIMTDKSTGKTFAADSDGNKIV